MSEAEKKCLQDCDFVNVTQLLLSYAVLKEENQILKEENEKLDEENFNLREDLYIKKIAIPYKERNLEQLIEMPTYEQLQQENQQLKENLENMNKIVAESWSVLDEIREYSSDLHLYDNESLEFKISNELFEILDKVKE